MTNDFSLREFLEHLTVKEEDGALLKDVEWSNGTNPVSVEGVNIFAVYMYSQKKLKLLKLSENVEITFQPFNYELLTVTPIAVCVVENISAVCPN
ncbi:hypothetical protein H5410_017982 [Solanum commersonii]|uniref:Uncharacterized protein n=1 Tax=Solanum commersonii TaxID=4109 RepID=A0A9J6A0M8_SOLCO|nr:hypothetical protein H5410_017982 [Solanum commersonii]